MNHGYIKYIVVWQVVAKKLITACHYCTNTYTHNVFALTRARAITFSRIGRTLHFNIACQMSTGATGVKCVCVKQVWGAVKIKQIQKLRNATIMHT